jgi:uncharacterized repeat protein (TIGR03806 family)
MTRPAARGTILVAVLALGCGRREPPVRYGLDEQPPAPHLNLPASEIGPMPARLSETGAFADLGSLTPARGLVPYDLNVPFWSDGASKRRWVAVPDGTAVHFSPIGEWGFPAGTVFVKHFERDGRRLETRLLVCTESGRAFGASYRWRADGSDADLVPQPRREGGWYFPGPEDCKKCHIPSAGGVLGVNARQLNRDYAYPSGVTDNQLRAWAHAGLFDNPPDEGEIPGLPRLAGLEESDRSVEDRARSYLDANCGYCHRPGGAAADFDARYRTPLDRQALVNAPARINFGLDHARQVAPNDPWRSVVLVRLGTLEQTRMPPLGHERVDQRGIELLTEWVQSLPGPPVVAPPTVVPKGGDFVSAVRVELRHPDPAAVVRYTLDGSAPTPASPVYAGPLELKESATVRARAFKPDHTPSIPVQETFIVGE